MKDIAERARRAQEAVNDLGAGPPSARTRADELAELVCVLFGWTGILNDPSERGLALHELWSEWYRERGEYKPRDYPQLSDEYIAALARRREAHEARMRELVNRLVVVEPQPEPAP